ncbi:hypothetical protein [Myxococcus faecalis]|uniref:hypothetical protein n=1 Tax=Myxococcus faecalis TaxID=3115646 RepID=UPI003CF9C3EA
MSEVPLTDARASTAPRLAEQRTHPVPSLSGPGGLRAQGLGEHLAHRAPRFAVRPDLAERGTRCFT